MKTAYLDCIGGISGDMTLGALLDAGADLEQLVAGLRTLNLPGWEIEVARTWKCGIAAAKVEVMVRGEAAGSAPLLRTPPNDAPIQHVAHAHESYSHSHEHGHSHSHSHSHSHETHSTHTHGDDEQGTITFPAILSLIRDSGLPAPVKERAEAVYRRLAEAEAAVHGSSLDAVHLHEVGAVDSIIDVVGAVYAFHLLGVERIVCSPLPNGHGWVKCAHGLMPIPPPATAELLKGCPIRAVDVQGELVTPTGAALASTLAVEFGSLPAMTVSGTGYGAGAKDFPFPNLVRVFLGETADQPKEATRVTLVEANIDDQSPQLYEAASAALFAAGALDVWLTPIQMKKGRPAVTLSVLCEPARLEAVSTEIFRHTTTLGVRHTEWSRTCLEREWLPVETEWGTVRVKLGRQGGELRTVAPEYEECRTRAEGAGVPVKRVQAAAAAAAWSALEKR